MPPKTIRLVRNLSFTALQAKLDKELSLWYLLRTINHWGSGYLDLEYAVECLTTSFGYSKSAAYRILNAGDGIFWDKKPLQKNNRLQIKIHGLQKVAQYFDISCDGYFLEIPIEEFTGHGGNRVMRQRAWLYASFHPPLGAKSLPISRASITEATGVNRRTQQRYDRDAVERVANFANWQDSDDNITPIFDLVDGKTKQWLVRRKLGNSYNCRAFRGPRGMLGKINTAGTQSFNGEEACKLMRYFPTDESYINCLHRHDDSYIMVPAYRRVTRSTEWRQRNP